MNKLLGIDTHIKRGMIDVDGIQSAQSANYLGQICRLITNVLTIRIGECVSSNKPAVAPSAGYVFEGVRSVHVNASVSQTSLL